LTNELVLNADRKMPLQLCEKDGVTVVAATSPVTLGVFVGEAPGPQRVESISSACTRSLQFGTRAAQWILEPMDAADHYDTEKPGDERCAVRVAQSVTARVSSRSVRTRPHKSRMYLPWTEARSANPGS